MGVKQGTRDFRVRVIFLEKRGGKDNRGQMVKNGGGKK
jgi:hypothetical protein